MKEYRVIYKQNNIQYTWEVKADSELEAKQKFWTHFRYSDGISIADLIQL